MKVLGLDISTTKIGIALLDDEELLVSEVIKLKSNMTLEQRAHIFEEKMLQLDDKHVIMDVYIEAPAMMFGGGRTTAEKPYCYTSGCAGRNNETFCWEKPTCTAEALAGSDPG